MATPVSSPMLVFLLGAQVHIGLFANMCLPKCLGFCRDKHEALCHLLDRGRLCHRLSRLLLLPSSLEMGLACGRGGAPQPVVSDQPNGGL